MLRERFSRPLDRAALALSASTEEDRRLLSVDLWGSRVHARMLAEVGLLPRRAAARIDRGLRAIERRAARGSFPLDPALEDVHLNVESALTRAIGADGARLHTGRSRNDQVATDLALYLRDALVDLEERTGRLVGALLGAARAPAGRRVVAGWTHLQPAQRVYVAQILGTHARRFQRDADRLHGIRLRMTDCPLGSGALAGSSLPLDRGSTARWLGFARPSASSLDSVSDRDASVETLAALALFHAHASGLAEELVLGSMPPLDRVRLDDPFVTTSSLMPHKRNPDLAELVRAEAAPALGRLTAHLALLKALPLAYNRDLQAGKPLVFEAVARAGLTLDVLAPMVATAEFRGDAPAGGPAADTASVELADHLVRLGLPFREAHGRIAAFLASLPAGSPLGLIPADRLIRAFPELVEHPFQLPSPDEEPERRTTRGGSAWAEVRRMLAGVEGDRRASARRCARERRRLATLRARLDRPTHR